jgi:hypothetical protein
MGPDLKAAWRGRWPLASLAAAAIAVAALAGIAILAGRTDRPGPVAKITPEAPKSGKAVDPRAADLALLPGEVLVEPAQAPAAAPRPEPLMPRYASPAAPVPAPRGNPPRLIEKPIPSAPMAPPDLRAAPPYGQPRSIEPPPASSRERPTTPRYARREHPTSPLDRWPQPDVCETCGEVISVRHFPGLAEVRVRFDDGFVQAIRYPPPPPWRVGDRVRFEDGRLVRD